MKHKAIKIRIYPNKEQAAKLESNFGTCRFVFNQILAEQQLRYEQREQIKQQISELDPEISADAINALKELMNSPKHYKHLSAFDANREIITPLRREHAWLKDKIDVTMLQQISRDVATAYKNWFDSLSGKRKGPAIRAPRFKSKHASRQSFLTRSPTMRIVNNKLTIPHLKDIKCKLHREISGEIRSITISRNASGNYYASILVETKINHLPKTGKEIGLDLGLENILIGSDSIAFVHPEQFLSKTKRKLKDAQKKLSRKKKGSKNRTKQRKVVANLYQKLTDQRNWYYHNLSKYMVENFDLISMENLNVAGMIKNRKLSRKLHESAFSTLVEMIKYKADWYGKSFVQIGRFFPSSKTCSCCGFKLDELKLSTRAWICPSCGSDHNRDINAAINILNEGKRQVKFSHETGEIVDFNMSTSLQKFANKIERSMQSIVGKGSEKAARSLDVQ